MVKVRDVPQYTFLRSKPVFLGSPKSPEQFVKSHQNELNALNHVLEKGHMGLRQSPYLTGDRLAEYGKEEIKRGKLSESGMSVGSLALLGLILTFQRQTLNFSSPVVCGPGDTALQG